MLITFHNINLELVPEWNNVAICYIFHFNIHLVVEYWSITASNGWQSHLHFKNYKIGVTKMCLYNLGMSYFIKWQYVTYIIILLFSIDITISCIHWKKCLSLLEYVISHLHFFLKYWYFLLTKRKWSHQVILINHVTVSHLSLQTGWIQEKCYKIPNSVNTVILIEINIYSRSSKIFNFASLCVFFLLHNVC